jgi:aspartyl aminopeptidase
VTRNGSSLIAFGVGAKWEPGKATSMIGAHTGISCL